MNERIKNLLNSMAQQEQAALNTEFFAPCVRGGQIRARVDNLIYIFKPMPEDFEGWGVFLPVSDKEAELLEEASFFQVAEYLKLLRPLRLRLSQPLRGQTWLAFPANSSDAEQRFGTAQPVLVHLVTEGVQFEQIIARSDGRAFFFEEVDRRSDAEIARILRGEFLKQTPYEELRILHLTPEMRIAYQLATQPYVPPKRGGKGNHHLPVPQSDEERLRQALQLSGGSLDDYADRGDFWLVEWTTPGGMRHTSAISKSDLTVLSSGICLNGRDRDFDLQSLVGVIEGEW